MSEMRINTGMKIVKKAKNCWKKQTEMMIEMNMLIIQETESPHWKDSPTKWIMNHVKNKMRIKAGTYCRGKELLRKGQEENFKCIWWEHGNVLGSQKET